MRRRSKRQGPLQQAASLLNQQIWCWGCDIERPDGNWLLERGFERVEPTNQHEDCPSIYRLTLPGGQTVLLRGFGMFYGDPALGGVFLPRFNFQPHYTPLATLDRHPWSKADLPDFHTPAESLRDRCTALTTNAIEWIHTYEQDITQRLGLDYRRATLARWDDGNRTILPAEEMVPAWQSLAESIGDSLQQWGA